MEAPKSKRSPGRPKVKEDTVPIRTKVLNTASKLFMELGYEPVSLNMIADKAGVTKASLYYYFSNKAALFTTSVTEMMVRIGKNTQRILEQPSDLKTRLVQLAARKMSHTHIDFESMMREALPSLSAEQRDEIRLAEQGIHEVLADTFRQSMDRGEIRRTNPLVLSHAFTALMMLGNRELEEDGLGPREQLAEDIVHLFWDGMGG